jgi:Tol biopolymer transport system component
MRTIIAALLLLVSLASGAQEIRLKAVRRIKPEISGPYMLSGVLPGSRYLLVTGDGYKGLSILDHRWGRITKISSDNGAGYEPAVTADGKKIIFRTDSFSDNRKYSSLLSYNIETGGTETILSHERGLQPAAISGNRMMVKSDRGSTIESAGSAVTKSSGGGVFVMIEDLVPVIYSGEERKVLKPNGDGYYIWASLSPDGTRLVYNYQGLNTFICDLNGRVLFDAGRINAPKWLNNNIIIGMDDRDDGHRVISSEIVYYTLRDGKRRYLTETDTRAEMYPWPFADGRKIAFSTDSGELYVAKLRIR